MSVKANTNKTATLDEIRGDLKRFHRHALSLHEVGRYAVVVVGYCGGFACHAFVDGKYTTFCGDTLEEGLLLAIGVCQLGPKAGQQMAAAAKRLLMA